MRTDRLSLRSKLCLAVAAFTFLATATVAAAQQEKVLYPFNGKYGENPYAGLIFDKAGNLYGTTSGGGNTRCQGGCGTVFELVHATGGGWTEKLLHSFTGFDGAYPQGGLVFDTAGNLYGTTHNDGAYSAGTIFELKPGANGAWTEKTLHSFNPATQDGASPNATLIFDGGGNLYGTTYAGGNGPCKNGVAVGCGTVFELVLVNGAWKETVLYNFGNDTNDGIYPSSGLLFDAPGNLYGTTSYGGAYGPAGTVFELTPTGGGKWSEAVLFSFNGNDGEVPYASLARDAAGNLYGTTYQGAHGYGNVFELSPQTGGGWNESVLYTFAGGSDGGNPQGNLVFDSLGNLYGTTSYGGANCSDDGGCGTVFELSTAAGGIWTEKILLSFAGDNGATPTDGLIFDGSGKLYGTTFYGGPKNAGTVFELTP